MSMIDRHTIACARTISMVGTLAALLMTAGASASHAADRHPTFKVKHVRVTAAPPTLTFDLQRTDRRHPNAPAAEDSFRVRFTGAGRCWRSGVMVAGGRADSRRSQVCVVVLAGCDAVPDEARVLVETEDGRVLARARWRAPSQDVPVFSMGGVSMAATTTQPLPESPPMPTLRASLGLLKTMYRTPDPSAWAAVVPAGAAAIPPVQSAPPVPGRNDSPLPSGPRGASPTP